MTIGYDELEIILCHKLTIYVIASTPNTDKIGSEFAVLLFWPFRPKYNNIFIGLHEKWKLYLSLSNYVNLSYLLCVYTVYTRV